MKLFGSSKQKIGGVNNKRAAKIIIMSRNDEPDVLYMTCLLKIDIFFYSEH